MLGHGRAPSGVVGAAAGAGAGGASSSASLSASAGAGVGVTVSTGVSGHPSGFENFLPGKGKGQGGGSGFSAPIGAFSARIANAVSNAQVFQNQNPGQEAQAQQAAGNGKG